MPIATEDSHEDTIQVEPETLTELPFPPVTQDHILNCSVHNWHPRYKSSTPKTRLVPLPQPFIDYLRADGIFLPPSDSDAEASSDDESEPQEDPSEKWQETHTSITDTIKELGGRVHPKLNWSAPKDATFMSATNSMECMSANEVYVLLKSSDFVTHDLEQAFYGCAPAPPREIPFHLVLRKSIPSIITSMEFRCFVRARRLVAICQRELNHYDFLPDLVPVLRDLIEDFFDDKLRDTFPDDNFVFDVYTPQPKERGRVWLMDINPWAQRTDPLLFSWLELLTMEVPDSPRVDDAQELEKGVVRLSLRPWQTGAVEDTEAENATQELEATEEDVEDLPFQPEFRIVKRDDPEAYSFSTPLYSAHKLPREVVEAGIDGGGGMRDFMERWRKHEQDAMDGTMDSSDE